MSTDKLPQNDDELKEALDKLFADWKDSLKDGNPLKSLFITDGALPGYCERKTKILYLAREMHTTTTKSNPEEYIKKYNPEERNIVDFVDAFLSGRFMDKNPSGEAYAVKQITADGNDLKCWRLAARIAYSVLHWREPDSLDELSIESIRKAYKNEFSFAIIEMSKYNNIVEDESAPGISDYFKDFAEQSLGMGNYSSSKNFIREEIELLNPDLIISWNIRSVIAKRRFRKLLIDDPKCKDKDLERSCSFLPERAWTYTFDKIKDPSDNTKKKQIPLLDTYHFSTMNKSPKKDIYDPVMTALKELGLI